MNLPFEFRELDLQGLLDGVADGSLDIAVAAMSITAEREEICDFSHPYYVTGLGIAIAPKHKTCPRCMSVRFQTQPERLICETMGSHSLHTKPYRRACALSRRARLKRWCTMPQ
ncbi:MAG: transporter substrate-binding domain-containing protein, partial [Desulfobacterales bacterium]